MSYRVLTGPAIPFVHALPEPSGLGVEPATPSSAPWWGQIIQSVAQPFAQAGAQRLAYGKTDPYYSAYSGSPTYYGQGQGYGSSFAGISPTMLLLGGAALVAMMMLRK